jgi:hypothetical protein
VWGLSLDLSNAPIFNQLVSTGDVVFTPRMTLGQTKNYGNIRYVAIFKEATGHLVTTKTETLYGVVAAVYDTNISLNSSLSGVDLEDVAVIYHDFNEDFHAIYSENYEQFPNATELGAMKSEDIKNLGASSKSYKLELGDGNFALITVIASDKFYSKRSTPISNIVLSLSLAVVLTEVLIFVFENFKRRKIVQEAVRKSQTKLAESGSNEKLGVKQGDGSSSAV